jgi:dTDP-4-dehydrorhamnose reductase
VKILLVGESGQLGSSLLSLGSNHHWIAPSRDELDIESTTSCKQALKKYKPDVLINTAAFHNLPMCEQKPNRAFAVNCIAVRNLAKLCNELSVVFVTFSSDYVFDGTSSQPYIEEDKTSPIQIYGISRLAGENAALAVAPENTIVIRTAGLYGSQGAFSKGGNFVDHRINDATNLDTFEMGCDQTVSPTSALDLARAIIKLIEHPDHGYGIYHLVNEGQCSWYEFTCAIVDFMGFNTEVKPIDRGGLSGDMRRPLYSVLGNARGKKLGIVLPHWKQALREYIDQKYLNSENSE